MSSKDTRNAIISLFVLAAGIKVIQIIAGNYIPGAETAGLDSAIAGLNSLSDLVLLGVVVIALILIPIYAYQRARKKEE